MNGDGTARVLVVEDDLVLGRTLVRGLREAAFEVEVAPSGELALAALAERPAHVVVLDVVLPGIDGFETCRRLRRDDARTAVIMLSARGGVSDRVAGLEAGADDYLAKPVRPRVLEAKLKAVLRRTAPSAHASPPAPVAYGDLVLDRGSLVVTKGGRHLDLTPRELRLLLELAAHAGLVLSRQQLLSSVWGQDHLGDSRLVDACVQRLRAKIEDVPADPRLLHTVRGFGYRFGP